MTFYGEPVQPPAPALPVLDAETVGELVADGVTAGRFLILTTPESREELRTRGNDIDAYLEQVIQDYT